MRVIMGLGHYDGGGFTTVVNSLAKYLQGEGVETTVAARFVKAVPPSYLKLLRLTPNEFVKEARKHDIVHIHTSYPYLRVLLNSRFRRIVFTYHGYCPWYIAPGLRNKLIHLYLKYTYKRVLKKVPIITSVSDHVRMQVKDMFGLDSKVIYNGVDTEIFRPSKNVEKLGYPAILGPTAWDKLKGADILVKNFIKIKARYPEATLTMCACSNWTKKLVRKVGLKPDVDILLLPSVPQERLSYYYSSADFCMLTSRWESFCLPIVEAFACGTPVIMYDVPDARREHIHRSGAGLLYSDEESLLKAVEEVLRRRSVYSQRSIRYAKRLRWGIIVPEYLKVYESILAM